MDKHITDQPIHAIMTPSPVSVRPEATIAELKALFERYDFNAFPVVDEHGILRGLVSKLDLLRVFRPDKRRGMAGLVALWAERVDEVMSRGIVALEPHESVVAALDLMIEARRRSLPVVERHPAGPILVGMVSRGDVLQCLSVRAQESP